MCVMAMFVCEYSKVCVWAGKGVGGLCVCTSAHVCVCVRARAHTGTHTQVYTSIPIHICTYKGMSQRVCITDINVCVCIYV